MLPDAYESGSPYSKWDYSYQRDPAQPAFPRMFFGNLAFGRHKYVKAFPVT
jgi:hypothetical protein